MKFVALTLALALGDLAATPARSQPVSTGTTEPVAEIPSAAAPAATADPVPAADPAPAGNGDFWRLMASPYTYHFHPSDDHRDVYMIGLERQRADGLVLGGSLFSNSFGQPSAYLYVGWRFDRFTRFEPLFAQVTGGLLYGYKEPYENKVPFNHDGFSPGAVLSVGWQFTKMYSAQVNFLGNSALMFQFSVDIR
jgi:hypothetical protein